MNIENGREYVDLGLSVYWAANNLGLNSAEDYYYAWGECENKIYYGPRSLKYYDCDSEMVTKYCSNPTFGTVDNRKVLMPEDDAARQQWGGRWRMPTLSEWMELFRRCIVKRETRDGYCGYAFYGPNGNSIFMRSVGVMQEFNNIHYNEQAVYWTSEVEYYNERYATAIRMTGGTNHENADVIYVYRCFGLSIRPVISKY